MSAPPALAPSALPALSLATAVERLLPALHLGLSAALAQGTSYAQLPAEALTQLVRRLLQALRHGLGTGDCGPLLSVLDQPSPVATPVRLGTLADTQALLGILRRCGYVAARSELLDSDSPACFDLLDRLTDLLAQTAACDAQRRLGEMQNYALAQTQQCESMVALNEATSHAELMDIVVRYLAPLESTHARLVLFEETLGEPRVGTVAAVWARHPTSSPRSGRELDLLTDPLAPILRVQTLLLLEDLGRAPELPAAVVLALRERSYEALVAAPLYLRDRLIGSLMLGWQEPRRFSFHDTRLLRAIADQSSTVAARLQLLQESAQRFGELSALRDRLASRVAEQTAELRVFKALADNAPDGIFVADSQGQHLTYANPAFLALLQLPAATLGRVHRDALAESPELVGQIEAGLAQDGVWRGPLRYHRRDGTLLPAHLSTFLVQGEPLAARPPARDHQKKYPT